MEEGDFTGLIIGNFKIKKKIGDGAFSMVFLAEVINPKAENKTKKRFLSNSKKTYIACKIIPRKKVKEKKLSKILGQEIRIHQLMHHENVVQMIDIQKDDLFYYVFLEFCPCGALFDLVVHKGKLSEIESAIFFKQILLGLQYIHSMNVIHRDLKPENILIDQFGTIKIADFGLSKLLSNDSNSFTKTPCGSPCYVSPECISGSPYDGRKSDIWSCGVILYTILAGHLPWTCRVQSKLFKQIKNGEYKIPSHISKSTSELIQRFMTVDNSKRITIEEALNHPFLRNVSLKKSIFQYKFVSLRKIDLFLGADEKYEYYGIFDHLSIEIKQNCNSCCHLNFLRTRKCIEKIGGVKKSCAKNDRLYARARQGVSNVKRYKKSNRAACQIQPQSNYDDEENSKGQKKVKNKFFGKKEIKNVNEVVNQQVDSSVCSNYAKYRRRNIDGGPSLIPRRSEINSLLYSNVYE